MIFNVHPYEVRTPYCVLTEIHFGDYPHSQ